MRQHAKYVVIAYLRKTDMPNRQTCSEFTKGRTMGQTDGRTDGRTTVT